MYSIKKERGIVQSVKDMLEATSKSVENSKKVGEAMTQFETGHHFCCLQVESALKAILKNMGESKKPSIKIKHHIGAKAYYNQKYGVAPKVSQKRINNIIDAYPDIDWFTETVKITIPGYGDRPAFSIDGTLGEFPVQFHTNTPGGGAAKMYYWEGDKKKVICRASFLRAGIITKKLMKIHSLNL